MAAEHKVNKHQSSHFSIYMLSEDKEKQAKHKRNKNSFSHLHSSEGKRQSLLF